MTGGSKLPKDSADGFSNGDLNHGLIDGRDSRQELFEERDSRQYAISSDPALLQLARVHEFLSTKAYWCLGIPYETVARAAANSLCFGVYRLRETVQDPAAAQPTSNRVQVGYARVVTDYATFAWICDVYIDESARGEGLSKKLMAFILKHPSLQNLRRVCLATHDAPTLYEQFGFIRTKTPENWLEIKDDQIYLKR